MTLCILFQASSHSFVVASDLVGNPVDRISRNVAHIINTVSFFFCKKSHTALIILLLDVTLYLPS